MEARRNTMKEKSREMATRQAIIPIVKPASQPDVVDGGLPVDEIGGANYVPQQRQRQC